MPADDVGDDDAPGPPPHPFDRVWFHPSELGSPSPSAPPPPAPRTAGPLALAGLLGAVVTVIALGASGSLGGGSSPSATAGFATMASALSDDPLAELVVSAGAAVVAVRAAGADPFAPPVAASGVALGRHQVLTGAGAIAGATTVSVITGGRVLDATVVGVDAVTDLALLRVDDAELTPAQLGDGDGLAVGDSVIALGIAGGDHHWVGRGIVSALDRLATTSSGTVLTGLVETDLRPGATVAGGALVDASGSVVGVLLGGAPGHALPIGWARDVADQLATTGRAGHGWIGADALDASDRPGGGARLTAVAPDGPAAAAGLRAGDVVSVVDGERVSDVPDLLAEVCRRRPGDPVPVMLWRGEERMRIEVTLGDRAPSAAPGAV